MSESVREADTAGQAGRVLGDHRVMAVCTVDTVTTVSAQTAPNPSTLQPRPESHSQPTRREPTIISIFPRPDRLFISANQDGANIDNHIHIAADTARTLREHSDQGQTLGKVNDEH